MRCTDLQSGSLYVFPVTTHRSSHPLIFLQDLASRPRLQIKFSLLCGEEIKKKHYMKRYKKMKAFHTFASEFSSTFQTRHLVIFPAYIWNFNRLKYAYHSHTGNIWHTVWQQERNINGDKKGMSIHIFVTCSSSANSHTFFFYVPALHTRICLLKSK